MSLLLLCRRYSPDSLHQAGLLPWAARRAVVRCGGNVSVLVMLAQGLTFGGPGVRHSSGTGSQVGRRISERGGDAHACVGALGSPSPTCLRPTDRRQHLPPACPAHRQHRKERGWLCSAHVRVGLFCLCWLERVWKQGRGLSFEVQLLLLQAWRKQKPLKSGWC